METATPSTTREIRFPFGKNWAHFLTTLNEERILEAEKSLKEMLMVTSLTDRNFLDIGSGSGLFSLAARRLGAKVFSFDYDTNSVGCTQRLRDQFFPNDLNWTIEQGSALDTAYLKQLGQFDIVYSWGVLHHTGQMWAALENVVPLVKSGGKLFIALYNDQGIRSRGWWVLKRAYCSGGFQKAVACALGYPLMFIKTCLKSFLTMKNEFKQYKQSRGMSIWHDYIDWIGGFPFEVASINAIRSFYENKGFILLNLTSTKSWGNNQFVFVKK